MNRRFLPPALLAVTALCAVLTFGCSEDDDPTGPPPPAPPTVGGVSETVVSPGDTLVITGSNFVSPASSNTVTFTNPLGTSKPFAGSSTSLSVIVDQDATTGPVRVSHAGGSSAGPSVEVRRGIGDFFVFGGLGANNVLALPNPTATTRYLVVPHATNAGLPYTSEVGYAIDSETAVPVAATQTAAAALRAAEATGVGLQEAFEAWRWEQTRELVDGRGVPPRPTRRSAPATPQAPQVTRQFYVLKTTTGSVTNPASFQRVTAELRYDGARCLVYSDVDTLATGNFDGSHYRTIGEAFDNGIEATNVQYFGGYSDVDGNGKAIILSTPVVNRLTPGGSGGFIAGFFLSVDLYSPPAIPSGISNEAEIFYLLAADPAAQWGNTFPVQFTLDTNISTTAHEHEHMISFSHRIFNEGGVTQTTWLEEGMAHMAEDLNSLDVDNQKRTAIYMGNPGAISLEHNTAPLSQRGGIYLFLRLMADRYGTDILKEIVQSRCAGRACVQEVTGRDFYDLVAEFLAALYLSDRGVTADPRFNYTSIDLADFGTLVTPLRAAGGGLVAGDIRKSSGDFYMFTGALNTESRFTFTDEIGNARLRNVIVRVQ
ncbi:MAG: hypothetical protein OEX18_04705 [Candidatus Krumholzibacteria bacterium]|nr:hypothetical protein [Candidatus Krumholzibacteria bacterium]MDH4336560.1 hypothetical protein [Candidatus Krumholzibacteria bacterium]MDH5269641.1 hypothetical protein [Candidatus Krumholzibacteria bacterium]